MRRYLELFTFSQPQVEMELVEVLLNMIDPTTPSILGEVSFLFLQSYFFFEQFKIYDLIAKMRGFRQTKLFKNYR